MEILRESPRAAEVHRYWQRGGYSPRHPTVYRDQRGVTLRAYLFDSSLYLSIIPHDHPRDSMTTQDPQRRKPNAL